MHFATSVHNSNNEWEYMWHKIYFKPDFVENLRKYKRLPFATISESLEEVHQSNSARRELEEFRSNMSRMISDCTFVKHSETSID